MSDYWRCACGSHNPKGTVVCYACHRAYCEVDPKTLYHRNDPDTSREAAESTTELRARHMAMVRSELAKGPAAAEQIADKTGLDTLQVMKRITDLQKLNTVAETTFEHRNRSGRRATVWALL